MTDLIFVCERAKSNLDQQPGSQEVKPANVNLCYSGNLANVYFDLHSRKVTLNELNAAYPGMVDALVQHEGIGFVVAYEDDGEPVAFFVKTALATCTPVTGWR